MLEQSDPGKTLGPPSARTTTPSLTTFGPCLVALHPALLHREYDLPDEEIRIGRNAKECRITVSGQTISRIHCKVVPLGAGEFLLQDWPSRNGTFVNGERVDKAVLKDGDVIGVGAAQPPYLRFQKESGRGRPWVQTCPAKKEWTVGRAIANDIAMPFESTVSACHAIVRPHGDAVDIADQGSLNGLWVDGYRVRKARLRPTDTVTIGSTLLRFQVMADGSLHVVRRDCSDQISVECVALTRTIQIGGFGHRTPKTLLDLVTLSIKPGEFIGILGPSGAGKTMLLKSLNGYNPPDYGCILLNETPLYQSYDMFRNTIGYVPQDDIVHADLTVEASLQYVAQLRLPRDVSEEQRRDLIDSTIETLGLSHVRKNRIHELSGGQRKRVSIGCELITRPSILYLDEPTSGMDPSTEERLMRHFQFMARGGTTVLITTHILYNLDMLDRIVIMARGRLVFFGTPAEAMEFFVTSKGIRLERPTQIFEVLEAEDAATDSKGERKDNKNAVAEQFERKYIESGLFKRHVGESLSEVARDLLRVSVDQGTAQTPKTKLLLPIASSGETTITPQQTEGYKTLLNKPARRSGRFRLRTDFFSPRAFMTLTRRHFAIKFVSLQRALFYLAVPLVLALVTLTLRTVDIPDDAQVAQDKQKITAQLHKSPGSFPKAAKEADGTSEKSTKDLIDAADKVTSSANELSSKAGEVATKANDAATSTQKLADSSKDVSTKAHDLGKGPVPGISGLVASTESLAVSAETLADGSKKLADSSDELAKSATKLGDSAKDLSGSVKDFDATELDLGDAVKDILSTDDTKKDERPAVSVVYALKHEGIPKLPTPLSVLLMFVMTSVFMGTLMSCLDLSTERPIYVRERMTNQKIADYLLSKLPFLLLVTAVQCAVFMAVCYAKPGLRQFDIPTVYVALLAMTWASSAMGLFISALDPTPGQFSVILAIVVVLPQMVLSGGLAPDFYLKMNPAIKAIASLFPARWGLEMLITSFYNHPGREALQWVKATVEDPIGFQFGTHVFLRNLPVLFGQGVAWLALCAMALKRLDRKR